MKLSQKCICRNGINFSECKKTCKNLHLVVSEDHLEHSWISQLHFWRCGIVGMIATMLLNTSYNNEIILLFQTRFYSIVCLEMVTWSCFISLHHSCSGCAAGAPTRLTVGADPCNLNYSRTDFCPFPFQYSSKNLIQKDCSVEQTCRTPPSPLEISHIPRDSILRLN